MNAVLRFLFVNFYVFLFATNTIAFVTGLATPYFWPMIIGFLSVYNVLDFALNISKPFDSLRSDRSFLYFLNLCLVTYLAVQFISAGPLLYFVCLSSPFLVELVLGFFGFNEVPPVQPAVRLDRDPIFRVPNLAEQLRMNINGEVNLHNMGPMAIYRHRLNYAQRLAALQEVLDRFQDYHIEQPGGDLQRVARHEGAMMANNQQQRTALNEMQRRYRIQFQQKGRPQIFNEIRDYLIAQYARNPARNKRGQPLPLNEHLPTGNKPYYRHPVHTAYRYLCLRPNPWINRNNEFTVPVGGGYAANIDQDDLNKIAYMWLAANDPNGVMPEGYDREGLLNEFIQAIAELGRAHNYDRTRRNARGELEHYDDMEADKPTCGIGVNQRITQFYMVFLNERPEIRPLTAGVMATKFLQEMINESPLPGSMYYKIRAMTPAMRDHLASALNKGIMLDDDLTPEETAALQAVKHTDADITAFIDACKTHFSADRITHVHPADARIAYMAGRFNTYEEMIRHLSQEAVKLNCEHLLRHIQQLRAAPQDEAALDAGAASRARGRRRARVA